MRRSAGASEIVGRNRKARFEYRIIDHYEAGIELIGSEVKSLRAGKVNIADAYAKIVREEAYLINANISPYENGGYANHEPLRRRKLLLRRAELKKLKTKLVQRGYTLVPLKVYFKRQWAKIELGLAQGKKMADKRQDMIQKEAKKEIRHHQ